MYTYFCCHVVQYSVETADIETSMYKCIPTENIYMYVQEVFWMPPLVMTGKNVQDNNFTGNGIC